MPRRPKSQWLGRAPADAGVRRTPPPAPEWLGEPGRSAWEYIWGQYWVSPERHRLSVERYCRITDLAADAHAELKRAGLMQLGSAKQLRCHPVMVEIRQLSAELRALEIELALTPSSASKAGVPLGDPGPTLEDLDREAAAAATADDDFRSWLRSPEELDDDDPIAGLRVIEGGAS